ncbi:MAG TPA: tetratricopeptide repeat protein [Thermodesulfobacteriota bacterium]|nr:tetratricopeptide repeat protein [Thermodesulfobacteriota bacterium]
MSSIRFLRRMSAGVFFFTILFIFDYTALSFGQENLPAIIRKIEPSIVSILILNKEGKISGQGSGFFINQEGDVITSRHVLEGASRANVITSGGKGYTIKKVTAEDPEGDLILISIDLEGDRIQPLNVSSTSPETGERVIIIGTPLGLERTVSDGIVSAVRDVPGFGKIIQVTAPISPGSSGSPVVNMRGEVIGIATFFIIAGQNLNFAIPGERIAKLIRGEGQTLLEREDRRIETLRASEEYLYATGLRYLWAEDYGRALPHFVEAIKRNPKHAEAYFQIGYCLGKLGKYQEAIESYQQALRIKPNDADTHNNLCVAYGMIGRYPEAIAFCQRTLLIKPDFAESYNNMAWSLHKLGRYQEAIDACKEAIRLKPDFALAHYNLGNNYGALKQYKEAMESYKEAIRIKFDHAEGHLNLGAAYNEMGRYEDAIASYRQAIRIKPDLAEGHLNLGMTYLKLGDRGAALDEYKVLKEQNREMANRLFNLIYE